MTAFAVLNLQSTLSLIVFALIGWWYVAPALAGKPFEDAVVPLLFVHAFRYGPLTLLVPGQVADSIPSDVAETIAYGDLASGALAILAILFLRFRWTGAVAMTWLFTAVGIADVIAATVRGIGARLYAYDLGFNWYILNFYVPALIVTHVMIVVRLLRRRSASASIG